MPSAIVEERVGRFQGMLGSPKRLGVSEFARSKDWRGWLPDAGCFEVVDRGGVVGYMIAPDLAEAISNRISQLELQIEQDQIAAMFEARAGRTDLKSGKQLGDAAAEYIDANFDALMDAIDGD